MAEFISFGYRIIWISLLALVSYIFRRRLAGHLLSIQRISLSTLSLHGVEYSGTLYSNAYAFTFTTPMVTLRLQIPSSSEPLWLTLTVHSIFFTSTTCDISTAKLKVVLWFFPLLQRRTAGPWADVALEDLVIKVHSSTQTPYWVQKLRQNVVGTVLAGEILRVDDFWTSIRFANLSEPMENPQDQSSASDDEEEEEQLESDETSYEGDFPPESYGGGKVQPFETHDPDEIRFSILARQLHINNTEGRIYTFGRVDAQLRRNWSIDQGSFVMVSEENRWTRVHWPYQRERPLGWWSQLALSLLHFPLDCVHTLNYPMSNMNLYVTRLDITFDRFRIRDAELLRQSISLIREKSITSKVDWGGVFFDTLADIVACTR